MRSNFIALLMVLAASAMGGNAQSSDGDKSLNVDTGSPSPLPYQPVIVPTFCGVHYVFEAFFDENKTTLRPESTVRLDKFLKEIKALTHEVIVVVGHTDSTGDEARNRKLSEQRAETVKAYFVAAGVESHRVLAEGKGSKQPATDNKTPEERAKNRRVEVETVGFPMSNKPSTQGLATP